MSTTIMGVVTNGVVVPKSPLPEGTRVEIHLIAGAVPNPAAPPRPGASTITAPPRPLATPAPSPPAPAKLQPPIAAPGAAPAPAPHPSAAPLASLPETATASPAPSPVGGRLPPTAAISPSTLQPVRRPGHSLHRHLQAQRGGCYTAIISGLL